MTCSNNQVKIVKQAFKQAKPWLEAAEKAVVDYANAPTAPKNKNVAEALKNHFGWTEALRKADEFGSMNPTKTFLSNISELRKKIEIQGHPSCQPTYTRGFDGVRVRAAAPEENSNDFVYTDAYFQKDWNSTARAKTVIHEMCHSWLHMDDVKYEADPGYPPDPPGAMSNADSNACAIRDIGKRRVS